MELLIRASPHSLDLYMAQTSMGEAFRPKLRTEERLGFTRSGLCGASGGVPGLSTRTPGNPPFVFGG